MSVRFDLTTPEYRLSARGVARSVSPSHWEGSAVADAADAALAETLREGRVGGKPIVVGLVPFNSETRAIFYVPRDVDWSAKDAEPLPCGDSTPELPNVRDDDSLAYRASVAEALRRIRAGNLEKVVLARRVTVERGAPIDSERVYARLCALNRNAYVYRFDLPEDAPLSPTVLLGASPELILGSRKRKIHSLPLAGSTPRGADALSDQEAADALLKSRKDLAEHRYVVQSVAEVFRRFADEVEVPPEPQLVPTTVIWHLGTPITGILREGTSPIELVYALHPTPAVGGWPREVARQTIAELEGFDRGFYAGVVGWMDAEGNGEWVLVLRGGIVKGSVATAFAGAGIVANSDPEKEYAETVTKLRTFIGALG